MADDTELLFFGRGQVSIDGQDPQNITDFDWSFTNGAKLKPTLRLNPGALVPGTKAVSFNFNVMISAEAGEEVDYDTMVDLYLVVPFLLKSPDGVVRSIIGALTEAGGKFTVDDGVARSLKGVGKLILPSTA